MTLSWSLQVFVCRSGSAADTQAITAYVQYYLHQHQMELKDEILVKTAASFATKLVYSNKASSPSTRPALDVEAAPQPLQSCVTTKRPRAAWQAGLGMTLNAGELVRLRCRRCSKQDS